MERLASKLASASISRSNCSRWLFCNASSSSSITAPSCPSSSSIHGPFSSHKRFKSTKPFSQHYETQLRQLFIQVHPDLFYEHPEAQELNSRSLSELNALLDWVNESLNGRQTRPPYESTELAFFVRDNTAATAKSDAISPSEDEESEEIVDDVSALPGTNLVRITSPVKVPKNFDWKRVTVEEIAYSADQIVSQLLKKARIATPAPFNHGKRTTPELLQRRRSKSILQGDAMKKIFERELSKNMGGKMRAAPLARQKEGDLSKLDLPPEHIAAMDAAMMNDDDPNVVPITPEEMADRFGLPRVPRVSELVQAGRILPMSDLSPEEREDALRHLMHHMADIRLDFWTDTSIVLVLGGPEQEYSATAIRGSLTAPMDFEPDLLNALIESSTKYVHQQLQEMADEDKEQTMLSDQLQNYTGASDVSSPSASIGLPFLRQYVGTVIPAKSKQPQQPEFVSKLDSSPFKLVHDRLSGLTVEISDHFEVDKASGTVRIFSDADESQLTAFFSRGLKQIETAQKMAAQREAEEEDADKFTQECVEALRIASITFDPSYQPNQQSQFMDSLLQSADRLPERFLEGLSIVALPAGAPASVHRRGEVVKLPLGFTVDTLAEALSRVDIFYSEDNQ